eukprot:scaffold43864_cov59-Phaeocystis_antarctica.AAC.11
MGPGLGLRVRARLCGGTSSACVRALRTTSLCSSAAVACRSSRPMRTSCCHADHGPARLGLGLGLGFGFGFGFRFGLGLGLGLELVVVPVRVSLLRALIVANAIFVRQMRSFARAVPCLSSSAASRAFRVRVGVRGWG